MRFGVSIKHNFIKVPIISCLLDDRKILNTLNLDSLTRSFWSERKLAVIKVPSSAPCWSSPVPCLINMCMNLRRVIKLILSVPHLCPSGGPGSCWGLPAVHYLCRVSELRRPPLRLVCPLQHVSCVCVSLSLSFRDLASPKKTPNMPEPRYVRPNVARHLTFSLSRLQQLLTKQLVVIGQSGFSSAALMRWRQKCVQ